MYKYYFFLLKKSRYSGQNTTPFSNKDNTQIEQTSLKVAFLKNIDRCRQNNAVV